MPILQLEKGQIEWGGRALLQEADLVVEARERIAIIGRNGEGKSTLLQACAGAYRLDGGRLWVSPGLRAAYLPQEPELPAGETIFQVVSKGLGPVREALGRYETLTRRIGRGEAHPEVLAELAHCQAEIDAAGAWNLQHRVDAALDRLGLDPDCPVDCLSGGGRKRVALAQTLAMAPDALLLDEPTNHLDLPAIQWLEETLLKSDLTLLFITHDRRFLARLATRIVELDRGRLTSFPGDYAQYQRRKEEMLNAEAQAGSRLDEQLDAEEAWLRQGVKARAKRNQGRLRRLERLRAERTARKERLGQARMRLTSGERSGQLVAELDHVSFDYGDHPIIRDFSTRIQRGDRVGIIGPNGAGKTTLLRLLLGELEPTAGCVRRGTNLQVAYFDQMRASLDPEDTVADAVSGGTDFLEIDGNRRHVIGYLQDFLFSPAQARGPVKNLSGGERARLLLARLFTRPANILVLDEPTNDLDLETLELLEELLQDYDGTLFLVSHDRDFLDNVVTQVIAFEGGGRLAEYAGGYSDWEWLRETAQVPPRSAPPESAIVPTQKNRKTGLSFKEQKELECLPTQIEALEEEQERLTALLADPESYRDAATVKALQEANARTQTELERTYGRWEELEGRRSGTGA